MANYKYYNANSKGNFTNDCVVRSIAVATNHTWDETYDELSELSQLKGKLLDDAEFVRELLNKKYHRLPYKYVTVGQIAREYPNNVLLITMKGHITCSRYGVVYDSFDCTNEIVEYCWIVK